MADDMPSGLVIFALGFGLLLTFVLLLWAVNVLPAKVREIMSRAPTLVGSVFPGLDRSVDQSAPTSLEPQTTPTPETGLNADSPDMDAEEWQMPRVSAYLADDEFLVMLARQKTRGGGWRLSANAIVKVVGADRTQVLSTIRAVREGPAEFPALTSEQQAARQTLGLNGQQKSETV